MPAVPTTLRYRNFSTSKPSSSNPTPRGSSSLATFEKEPERDPEIDCFMCRQAHVYIKPIGMQQERRVRDNQPPPLTREEIDELSQKKQLTKKEVRKLLQCYFPEIKDIKYFQLHRYHSCCYDPKHLNLCKNHITALQTEREQHPGHHHDRNENGKHENFYENYEREGGQQQNRVSFVRIKIEPTRGIPTRFLGPAVLPEPLADMLIKQVNRFEKKKRSESINSNHKSQSANSKHTLQSNNVGKLINTYGFDGTDYEDDDDIDEDQDDDDDDDDDQISNDNKQISSTLPIGKVKTKKNSNKRKKSKLKHWELLALEQSKEETCNCRHHVTRVEDNQLVHDWCRCKDHRHKDLMERCHSTELAEPSPREVRLAVNEVSYDWCKCTNHRHAKSTDTRKPLALPSVSKREMGAVTGQANYDWCQCKDPQHEVPMGKRKSITSPPRVETKQTMLSTAQRLESVQATPHALPLPGQSRQKRREESKHKISSTSQRDESVQTTPPQVRRKRREEAKQSVFSTPQREESIQATSPLAPQTHKKRREIHTRTADIEEGEESSTELALAYDPSAVDYDIIQEAIYYRTSSGRLIKPKITNSFTYDSGLPSTTGNHRQLNSNRDEPVYMTHNGQLQLADDDERRRRKNNGHLTPSKSVILSNPGSVYRGQAYFDNDYVPSNNGGSNTMPLLKLPSLPTSSRQHNRDNQNEYQPAEFTLAKFSNNSADPSVSQRSQAADSPGGRKTASMSMQTSTKPTYTNTEPTPNFGRQSSVVANRRWFDQPLGDQNLRPVHDSEYGVIAATSSDPQQNKSQTESNHTESGAPKKENKCTIS